MPIVTCHVQKVSERPVRNGVKFDIHPQEAPPPPWSPVYETFDEWTASLCARAMAMGFPVTLGLRETKFGLEIVSAERAA